MVALRCFRWFSGGFGVSKVLFGVSTLVRVCSCWFTVSRVRMLL